MRRALYNGCKLVLLEIVNSKHCFLLVIEAFYFFMRIFVKISNMKLWVLILSYETLFNSNIKSPYRILAWINCFSLLCNLIEIFKFGFVVSFRCSYDKSFLDTILLDCLNNSHLSTFVHFKPRESDTNKVFSLCFWTHILRSQSYKRNLVLYLKKI
jgi:hypothetical protein